MACPNWPNWPVPPTPSAAVLLNNIIQLAGNNPDAQGAKAAAFAALASEKPKTNPNFSCEYYYGWVVAAWDSARGGDWASTRADLDHIVE